MCAFYACCSSDAHGLSSCHHGRCFTAKRHRATNLPISYVRVWPLWKSLAAVPPCDSRLGPCLTEFGQNRSLAVEFQFPHRARSAASSQHLGWHFPYSWLKRVHTHLASKNNEGESGFFRRPVYRRANGHSLPATELKTWHATLPLPQT
jgi:hypothetical protein